MKKETQTTDFTKFLFIPQSRVHNNVNSKLLKAKAHGKTLG